MINNVGGLTGGCNCILTKTSLLCRVYRWWSHTIQFYLLFKLIIKCNLSTFHTVPWNEYKGGPFLLPLSIAFCCLRNLRDLLLRSSLTTTSQEPPGNHPCAASCCEMCPTLTTTDEFTSHMTGWVFKMKFAASYKSSSIIYLITCKRCG